MDIEKNIEQYFVRKVKAAGGWPVKLACPGTAGMPDRMVLWPEGECQFVELKRPGGRPRPLQVSLMNRLQIHQDLLLPYLPVQKMKFLPVKK